MNTTQNPAVEALGVCKQYDAPRVKTHIKKREASPEKNSSANTSPNTSPNTKIQVLENISFAVAEGRCAVISGQSGSGKTTLLSVLSGLEPCSAGAVRVAGTQISDLSEEERARFRLRSVGFVFQHHYLLQDFTALGNVMLPLLMAGESKKRAEEKAREMLLHVGLAGRLSHRPVELSGGECQRVAVARAVVQKPAVVFADEPTGALDTRNSETIRALLKELTKTLGTTLIVATHDKSFARIADAHLELRDGRIKGALRSPAARARRAPSSNKPPRARSGSA